MPTGTYSAAYLPELDVATPGPVETLRVNVLEFLANIHSHSSFACMLMGVSTDLHKTAQQWCVVLSVSVMSHHHARQHL